MHRTRFAAFAALALAGAAPAPFVFAQSVSIPSAADPAPASADTGILPHTAVPTHYAIRLDPDERAMTFAGTFAIDLDVQASTDTLVLNASLLKIADARLIGAAGHAAKLTVTTDAKAETVRFAAAAPIAVGHYRLEGHYTGHIDTQANGLFALDYQDLSGKDARALFTQFEPTYARQLAPMFDEPADKATFDLSVVVPAAHLAVSNMPVASEMPLGKGRKLVTFQTTPRMSSYLLFFGEGDFERLAKQTGVGVEVGIVSPRGSGEQARFALDELARLIPFYNDYFGQAYPLPKLDNIAGPGQSESFAAMENWGAVFTFQRDLLDDPNSTTPKSRNFIAVAQAHEVAHQWFGDLVTMAWWDDLWLNEGFASWMEDKAIDHLHPDWSQLLTRIGAREQAMTLDGMKTTHPVVQHVRTPEEANEAFDEITYEKGAAVIAMLEAYAGETTWRNGIRAYMAAHKFGNSRTEDLWRAVEAAGATGLTTIARDFTTQPGIPLVRVSDATCANGRTTLTLVQDEFTRDRVGEVSTMRWHVPILASVNGAAPVRAVLADGKASLTLDGCGPVVLNSGQLGYFRTLYTPAELTALAGALPGLAPIDQRGLVADQFALAEAGFQPMAGALAMVAAVPVDADPQVASEAIGRFSRLYDRMRHDQPGQAALAARATALWQPRLDRLGLEPRAGETLPDADLRAGLVGALGKMGDQAVVAEARRRFAALDRDPHALDGPLKQVWLGIVARKASPAEWEKLEALAEASHSSVDRADLFRLLGNAEDPALTARALTLAITDKPGKTNGVAMISAVASHNTEQAFDFYLANRPAIEARIDASGRGRYVGDLTDAADTEVMLARMIAYAATLDADSARPLQRAIAFVRTRLASNPRIMAETKAWLTQR